jgi:hypothetical protein
VERFSALAYTEYGLFFNLLEYLNPQIHLDC